MNTTQKGAVRCIVFEEEGIFYGVALEFNIVISGEDQDVVMYNLNEAIRGYVNSLKKVGGIQNAVLNQKSDKEYEDLWKNLHSKEPVPSPYQVRYFGVACV